MRLMRDTRDIRMNQCRRGEQDTGSAPLHQARLQSSSARRHVAGHFEAGAHGLQRAMPNMLNAAPAMPSARSIPREFSSRATVKDAPATPDSGEPLMMVNPCDAARDTDRG